MTDAPAAPTSVTYGFLGLGSMGSPMAGHLADFCAEGNDELLVWNRSPGRYPAVTAKGAEVVIGPAELLTRADVVFVMLPDLPELEELTDGPAQLLAGVVDRTVLVVCSSVSPAGVRAFADRAAQLTDGLVRVVDAPVSGGAEGARAGTLAIMVGGADGDVAPALAGLGAMGTTVRHLGTLGAGSLAKACNQMVVAATLVALSEASVLAESAGLSVPGLLEILAGGFGSSRVLEVKTPNLSTNSYLPTGVAKYMVKDLRFVEVEAERTGAPIPQALLSADLFADVVAAGLGDLDVSVVHALIRSSARFGDVPHRDFLPTDAPAAARHPPEGGYVPGDEPATTEQEST